MDKFGELNSADESQAVKLLTPLIERAPDISRRVAKQRPFKNAKELNKAIQTELRNLSASEKIELFREHPELAPDNPLAIAHSGRIRPLIPTASGHPFRFDPATDSGASGHP